MNTESQVFCLLKFLLKRRILKLILSSIPFLLSQLEYNIFGTESQECENIFKFSKQEFK